MRNILNIQRALESIKPGRLKRGLTSMMLTTLEDIIEIGQHEQFDSNFFSDLQILFDFLDELKQIRKEAKQSKE
jgi:hypothetical protein